MILLGYNIPKEKVRIAVNARSGIPYTNLEWFQCVLATLEHFTDSRLLLALGEIVHRLVNLDRRRQG